MHPSLQQAPAVAPAPAYPARLVAALLVISACYLAVLSFINARGIAVSPALVGTVEAGVYALCLGLLIRRLPLSTAAFSILVFAWLLFTWLVRQSPDPKSLRDLLIPILFISLGRYVADIRFADRCLKLIVGIVVGVGVFEVLFVDTYAELLHTFAFYTNVAGIDESQATFKGQMLSLNGYRPEGIGRTILPLVLGPHRASSVFLEPVAMGNFAVIVFIWALSLPWKEMHKAIYFFLGAALIITLADSRFGLMMAAVLIATRCIPLSILRRFAPLFPLIFLGAVLGITLLLPTIGDNLLGRITISGNELLKFDWRLLMGVSGPLPPFGDMGFAYLLSRFGAVASLALLATLFLIPMDDLRGIRFRALVVLYIFANLAISGTSVFALKTAGLLWFLFGVLAVQLFGASRVAQQPPQGKSSFDGSTQHALPHAFSLSKTPG